MLSLKCVLISKSAPVASDDCIRVVQRTSKLFVVDMPLMVLNHHPLVGASNTVNAVC